MYKQNIALYSKFCVAFLKKETLFKFNAKQVVDKFKFFIWCTIYERIIIYYYCYSGANEEVKLAKRKLQMLNNHVFEELAMDVYDEVDRRETDSIWNSVHMKVHNRNWKEIIALVLRSRMKILKCVTRDVCSSSSSSICT